MSRTNSDHLTFVQRGNRITLAMLTLTALSVLALGFGFKNLDEAVLWGLISLMPCFASILFKKPHLSKYLFATSAVMLIATQIHIARGQLEYHFGFFALLGILAFYRDYKLILYTAGLIAGHHVLFAFLQIQGFECYIFKGPFTFLNTVTLHAFYVIAETSILVPMCMDSHREAEQATHTRRILQRFDSKNGVIDLRHIEPEEIEGKAFQIAKVFNDYREKMHVVLNAFSDTKLKIQSLERNTRMLTDSQEQVNSQIHSWSAILANLQEYMGMLAKETQQMANEAKQQTQGCEAASDDAEQSFSVLENETQTSRLDMQQLLDAVKNVKNMASSMREIADQTRLLALNAAIEAARSGESGRGFAVVADEVRKLSDRSAQDVEMVEKAASTIQETVNKVAKRLEVISHTTHEAKESREKLGGALSIIFEIGKKQFDKAGEVQTTLNQTQQLFDGLILQLHTAVDTMSHAKTLTNNTQIDLQETDQTLTELDSQLGQFKVA